MVVFIASNLCSSIFLYAIIQHHLGSCWLYIITIYPLPLCQKLGCIFGAYKHSFFLTLYMSIYLFTFLSPINVKVQETLWARKGLRFLLHAIVYLFLDNEDVYQIWMSKLFLLNYISFRFYDDFLFCKYATMVITFKGLYIYLICKPHRILETDEHFFGQFIFIAHICYYYSAGELVFKHVTLYNQIIL